MKIRWFIAGLSFTAITSLTVAAENTPPPPQPDPAVQGYLACINSEAEKQVTDDSNKISNAQTVIDACSGQKQALLNAINQTVANQMITQVEKHLRERESTTSSN